MVIREKRNTTANQGSGKTLEVLSAFLNFPANFISYLIPIPFIACLPLIFAAMLLLSQGGKFWSLLSLRGEEDLTETFYDQIAVNLPLTAGNNNNNLVV